MGGSHIGYATYAKDNVINYFDSFGLPAVSRKWSDHAKRKNLNSFTPKSTNTKLLFEYMWLLLSLFLK